MTVVDGKIYIVGGFTNDNGYEPEVNDLQILAVDLDKKGCKALSRMSCARGSPGVVAHDGKIFVFGGYGPNEDLFDYEELSSCEVYHVKENRWETIADMPTARAHVGVTELHGKIYVSGGENSESDLFENPELKVVECYDPEKNSWESLPNMEIEKYSMRVPVVGFNGKVFVGGGAREFDEDEEDSEQWKFDDIESFDIRKKQWSLLDSGDDRPYIKSMFVMHKKFLPPDL